MNAWIRALMIGSTMSVVSTTVFAGTEQTPTPQHSEDRIWVISTRHLTSKPGAPVDVNDFTYTRVRLDGECDSGDFEQFKADGVGRRTCVYVHGNRVSASYAIKRGRRVYEDVRSAAPDSESLRFVIWSWPSTRIKGLVRDARVKAQKTTAQSFYLGALLSHQPEDESFGVIGFSFGAPIICGAMHLVSGGEICGYSLPMEKKVRLKADVVLMAGAMGSRWLAPGGRYDLAFQQMEQLLLLRNSTDSALKRYWVVGGRGVSALGYVGLSPRVARNSGVEVRQCDVARAIGREHTASLYLNSRYVSRLMAEGALGVFPQNSR